MRPLTFSLQVVIFALLLLVGAGLLGGGPVSAEEKDSCVTCHQSLGGRHVSVVNEWKASIHREQNVGCASCHGGNPRTADMGASMSSEAGFRGVPAKQDIPQLCGSCHANVAMMRRFGLPTDQLAQYRESRHGLLLEAGDTKVATCFDCHGGHEVRKKNDPKSTVFPTNVPRTCSSCHSDAVLMKGYNIPTNQFDLYRGSVHGVTLLDKKDKRAPECATCHGTHGATPPGVQEVADVCGRCHSATQDIFRQGGHKAGVGVSPAPRCITCHGYHEVKTTSEELFLGEGPGRCNSCHASGTTGRQVAEGLYTALTDAADAYRRAQEAIERAEGLRMIMAEEREKLPEALTKLIEGRALQHFVDLNKVMEKTDKSIAVSEAIVTSAEAAIAQMAFRRKAMVVSVVLIGFVIGALYVIRGEIFRNQR